MNLIDLYQDPNLSQCEREALVQWLRIKAARGHASAFARKTNQDQSIIERSTASQWAQAVREKFGVEVRDIHSNPVSNDVPDCKAHRNDSPIGIELTELVDGGLLDDIKIGKLSSAFEGLGFERAQWGGARLAAYLIAAIEKKHTKYQRNGKKVDVLILHSDEPWLDPFKVERWLQWRLPKPRACIGSAFLLLTYQPLYSPSWPVFRIF